MNELIAPVINGFIEAFDNYEITNESLQTEVDSFKNKLIEFGESQNDIANFYPAYQESGLQEEYSALITKVAMAENSNVTLGNDNQASEFQLPSVKEFLEQYRPSYDEVCKRGGIKGRAAYEEVFDVANRTDDLLEAQIILEKERLLWKIVREDAIEIFENKLKEMDPLYLATTAKIIGQIKAYQASNCDEELNYNIEIQEVKDISIISDYIVKMNLAANLSFMLISYAKAKEIIYSWPKDDKLKAAICSMRKNRRKIKNLLIYMNDSMKYSFEDLMNDECIKIWMLNPQNEDEFGKYKTCLSNENFNLFKDIVKNEILADISIRDALLRV